MVAKDTVAGGATLATIAPAVSADACAAVSLILVIQAKLLSKGNRFE